MSCAAARSFKYAGIAEWHGFLGGVLAVDIAYPVHTSVSTLVADSADTNYTEELKELMDQVYEAVRIQMTDPNLQFELCLPDSDTVDLSKCVAALATWCEGFLFGLVNAGLQHMPSPPADTQEILQDLSRIAQLDGADTGEEDEEVSFNELMEFVRMAGLLIAEEVQPLKLSRELQFKDG